MTILIQIGIMLIAALLSYALRPKPKDPEAVKGNIPDVEDGRGIRRFYGTVWVDDSQMLAWRQEKPKKIYAKGGKK